MTDGFDDRVDSTCGHDITTAPWVPSITSLHVTDIGSPHVDSPHHGFVNRARGAAQPPRVVLRSAGRDTRPPLPHARSCRGRVDCGIVGAAVSKRGSVGGRLV